jgi:hypothetical protein
MTLDPSSYFTSNIFMIGESPSGDMLDVITNVAPVANVGKIAFVSTSEL